MASRDEGIESYTEEQCRRLNRFKGFSKKKLRENYRFITNLIEPDSINEELLKKDIFNEEQHRKVKQSHNKDYKKHNIVKQLLRLSEHHCFCFFEILHKKGKGRDLETISVAADKTIPENISSNHNIQQQIISSQETLVPQLEVHSTADCLLEYSVITLDEHDQILRQENRQAQRETLFDIILSKTNWVKSFIHVLTETEQQELLNFETQADTDLDLNQLVFGNTTPADDLVIIIRGDQTLEESIMRNMSDNAEDIEEFERNGVLDIYPGKSIYLYMPSGSNRVNVDDKSVLQEKMLELLKLLTRYCPFYYATPRQQSITVKALRKPHDSFLNECYGIPKSEKSHGNKMDCIRCLGVTVRKNVDAIICEIERDIIEETFVSTPIVSTFARSACLDKNVCRTTRAKRFILYILQHEDALRSFINVYREKSTVNLSPEVCKDCSISSTSVTEYHRMEQTPLVAEFKFRIAIDKSGINTFQTIICDGAYYIPTQIPLRTNSAPQQGVHADSRAVTLYVKRDKKKNKHVQNETDNQSTIKKRRQSSTL